jgi:cytochrome P450
MAETTIKDFVANITVDMLDDDPYPIYARLRREAPVCYIPVVDLWFITRWQDVEYAAQTPEIFTAAVDPSPVSRSFGDNNILTLDGERHKRLRAMLDPSFKPRTVEEYAPPLIRPIAEAYLAKIEHMGQAELMADYFEPISVLSLGAVLGLADIEGDTLRRWFAALAQGATNFEQNPEKQAVSDAASREIDETLHPLFEQLLRQPNGSTISTMLHAATGSLDERIAMIMPTLKVILLGGMQEPGHACGSTAYGLLTHPEQQQAFAAKPAGLVKQVVDEGLRWISPIGTQTRRVAYNTILSETELPAGANVGLLVSSANRDEAVWGPDAGAFNLFRKQQPHAAFGFGSHYCTGHWFSRVQMRMALELLFTRLKNIRLDPERPPQLRGWEFRAPAHLWVQWDA